MGFGGDNNKTPSSSEPTRNKSTAARNRSVAAAKRHGSAVQGMEKNKPKRTRSKFREVNMELKNELTKNAKKVFQAGSSSNVDEEEGTPTANTAAKRSRSTGGKRNRSINNMMFAKGINVEKAMEESQTITFVMDE